MNNLQKVKQEIPKYKKFLKNLLLMANSITNKIDLTVDTDDHYGFIVLCFLKKHIIHSKSILILSTNNKEQYFDTELIARSMFEGLFILKWLIEKPEFLNRHSNLVEEKINFVFKNGKLYSSFLGRFFYTKNIDEEIKGIFTTIEHIFSIFFSVFWESYQHRAYRCRAYACIHDWRELVEEEKKGNIIEKEKKDDIEKYIKEFGPLFYKKVSKDKNKSSDPYYSNWADGKSFSQILKETLYYNITEEIIDNLKQKGFNDKQVEKLNYISNQFYTENEFKNLLQKLAFNDKEIKEILEVKDIQPFKKIYINFYNKNFSAWHHWKISGFSKVLDASKDNAHYSLLYSLSTAFDCLFITTKYVNVHFKLKLEDKLDRLEEEIKNKCF